MTFWLDALHDAEAALWLSDTPRLRDPRPAVRWAGTVALVTAGQVLSLLLTGGLVAALR